MMIGGGARWCLLCMCPSQLVSSYGDRTLHRFGGRQSQMRIANIVLHFDSLVCVHGQLAIVVFHHVPNVLFVSFPLRLVCCPLVSRKQLVRNKTWNQLLNVCTIFHLILPMVEIQRCLPCMGMQKLPPSLDSNSLHIGKEGFLVFSSFTLLL